MRVFVHGKGGGNDLRLLEKFIAYGRYMSLMNNHLYIEDDNQILCPYRNLFEINYSSI